MGTFIHWIKAKLPDEMEKTIRLKSIQWAWLYSIVFLLVWMSYETYQMRQFGASLNGLPGLLLSTQILVLTASQLLYRFRLTKSEEAEERANRKKDLIILGVIAVLVLGFAVAATYAMLSVGA